MQVQNGQEVLGNLFSSILDMGLACWGSMAILSLYLYIIQVSNNDDEEHCFLKQFGFTMINFLIKNFGIKLLIRFDLKSGLAAAIQL